MKNNNLKFNVFDTAILVFIVAIIVCAYFQANDRIITLLPNKTQNAVITIVTDNDVYSKLSINDVVSFYNSEKEFGEVLSVVKRKKFEYITNDDGIKVKHLSQDSFEYVVRLKAAVKKSDDGIFLNSEVFCATGSCFDLFSGDLFFSGQVEKIKMT